MLIAVIAAVVVAICDQLFKLWIINSVSLGGQTPLIPGVIHLTNVQNTGAAFSLLENYQTVLLIISLVCIVAIVVFVALSKLNGFGYVTAGLIMGGALGNIIDRVIHGYVVDMFEVEFIDYAVFNIADCCIVVGGILFCVYYIFFRRPPDRYPVEDDYDGYDAPMPPKGYERQMPPKGYDRATPVKDFGRSAPPKKKMPNIDIALDENVSPQVDKIDSPDDDDEIAEILNMKDTELPDYTGDDVKTDWTETEILEEYSLEQILKDYYDKMD